MKNISVAHALILGMALSMTGCGTGGTPPDGPLGSNTAETTFDITNSCSQASSVSLRFFDETNGGVWPSSSTVYTLNDGAEQSYQLKCNKGDNICYGASLSTNANFYWGEGINNGLGCTDCCSSCGTGHTPTTLTCQ
jgi:hypothetical protein